MTRAATYVPASDAVSLGRLESPALVGDRRTVLVLHENQGIDPYMGAVVEELHRAGYHVVMPDLLSRLGGSPTLLEQPGGPPSPREIPHRQHLDDLVAALTVWGLAPQDLVLFGLCFGGELAWLLADVLEHIGGLIVYYGVGPEPGVLTRSTAPFLGIYADHDDRVNVTLPRTMERLEGRRAPTSLHRFGGTRHAFHNPDRPDRHDADAARAAWGLTLEWLAQHAPVARGTRS